MEGSDDAASSTLFFVLFTLSHVTVGCGGDVTDDQKGSTTPDSGFDATEPKARRRVALCYT